MSFYQDIAKKVVYAGNLPFIALEELIRISAKYKNTTLEDEMKTFDQERRSITNAVDLKLNDFDEYEELDE